MPPGPIYNWVCIVHSASEILANAISIRSKQVSSIRNRTPARSGLYNSRTKSSDDERTYENVKDPSRSLVTLMTNPGGNGNNGKKAYPSYGTSGTIPHDDKAFPAGQKTDGLATDVIHIMPSTDSTSPSEASSPFLLERGGLDSKLYLAVQEEQGSRRPPSSFNIEPTAEVETFSPTPMLPITESVLEDFTPLSDPRRTLQASRVPSSRIGRLFHYGGLAASLGYGAATEVLRRSRSGDDEQTSSSLIMTPSNVSRLVSKLSRMRGAALKLGQFMSIQDSRILPKDVEEIFRRVQDSAHYMPNWQMQRVMSLAFGQSWRDNFVSFDSIPFAAASLGQVHRGVLAASGSPTGKDEDVAVKVQFPDIAKSLESDLGYMKLLLTAGSLLPRGLFLDRTIKVMKEELKDECDYVREASFIRAFAAKDRLGNDSRFCIPWVWEGSTSTVLVMKHMEGVSVGGGVVDTLSKEDRNAIASGIVELCMKELFEFRMMQTDPNWTNFLWNRSTRQIALIDFGATREYSKSFIDKWMHLLQAAVSEDREACVLWSRELGYLTGEENDIMVDAHVRSLMLLGHPFRASTGHPVSFGPGTEYAGITGEIRSLIPVMLTHRLTPPPRETYSLNRKLSGAFLLASRLNASVDCRAIWDGVISKYKFEA